MIRLASRLSLAAAAATLSLTPVAAQANTRAADAQECFVCGSAQSASDIRTAERIERRRGRGGLRALRLILGTAAFAALVAAIIASTQDGNQSPGT